MTHMNSTLLTKEEMMSLRITYMNTESIISDASLAQKDKYMSLFICVFCRSKNHVGIWARIYIRWCRVEVGVGIRRDGALGKYNFQ